LDGNIDGIMSFPRIRNSDEPEIPPGMTGVRMRVGRWTRRVKTCTTAYVGGLARRAYGALPPPLQNGLAATYHGWLRACGYLWEFMNPPLWAMLIAILVASIPKLQHVFFEKDSFINNSVTSAVSQSAGVAVPLILVVLGANLARNTQQRDERDAEEKQIGTRLLIASLISRMVLPTIIVAPILALMAKYVPISILDDPIFVVVCFLITGAPTALQLAQICQINGVYENVMSRILFQSYVIW
jgi:hypothetical protein